jgi:transposase
MQTARDKDVSVSGGAARRHHRSKQERRRIAEESLEPGASVAVIARAHHVNANQVFHWRKLLREGRLGGEPASTQLMPVRIAEVAEEERETSGTIHIELGRARVHVEGSVDLNSLRMILEHFGR